MDAVAASLERDFPNDNLNLGALLTPLRSDLVADVKPTCCCCSPRSACCCSSRPRTSRACSSRAPPRGTRRWPSGSRSARAARRILAQLLTESVVLAVIGGAAGILLAMWLIGPLVALSPADLAVAGAVHRRSQRPAVRPRGLDAGRPAVRPRAGAPARAAQRARRSETGRARRQRHRAAADPRGAGRGGDRAVAGAARRRRPDDSQLRQAAARAGRIRSGSRAHARRQPAGGAIPDAGAEGGVLAARARVAAPGARRRGRRRDQPPAAAARQQHARADDSRSAAELRRRRRTTAPRSPDYFRAMGIQLLRGRVFEEADREGRPLVAVVSASAAQRFWPNRNPIGERFSIDEPEITIVGVVGDVHAASLDAAPQPTVYVPYRQDPWPFMTFALRTTAAPATLPTAVRDAIWRVDKDQPVGAVRTMDRAAVEFADAAALQRHAADRIRRRRRVAGGDRAVRRARVHRRAAPARDRRAHGARRAAARRHRRRPRPGPAARAASASPSGSASRWPRRGCFSSPLFGTSPTDALTYVAVATLLVVDRGRREPRARAARESRRSADSAARRVAPASTTVNAEPAEHAEHSKLKCSAALAAGRIVVAQPFRAARAAVGRARAVSFCTSCLALAGPPRYGSRPLNLNRDLEPIR